MFRWMLASLALVVALGSSSAYGGIITTGNSHPFSPDLDAFVNFAVVENTTGDWSTSLPGLAGFTTTSGPALDNGAQYLYLYQIVNLGSDIENITVNVDTLAGAPVDVTHVTSWGYFAGLGFKETPGGEITNGSNETIGAPATGGLFSLANIYTDATTLASVGVDSVSSLAVGETPTSVSRQAGNGQFLVTFLYDGNIANFDGLDAGDTSVLFGFTSSVRPVFGSMAVNDNVVANGEVPTARDQPDDIDFPILPEPASMIVWALGAGLVGTVGYFKRRRTAA